MRFPTSLALNTVLIKGSWTFQRLYDRLILESIRTCVMYGVQGLIGDLPFTLESDMVPGGPDGASIPSSDSFIHRLALFNVWSNNTPLVHY